MRLLNLGCGTTFHSDWVNVDIQPAAPGVLKVDLRERLPFPDRHFDAVYHSHVLEHFPAEQAERFVREALRVLRPGGIMRVVVPDLEQIARLYLQKLSAAERGEVADHDYRWMMLELYDQTVRDRSGGLMKQYLQGDVDNLDFVRSRIGAELDGIRRPPRRSIRSVVRALRSAQPTDWARRQLTRGVVRVVGGRSALAELDEGRFRRSGEIHQWMYDGYSLRRLLDRAGARDVQRCDARTSRIPGFDAYQLDAIDGVTRKPDSMFFEGLA